MSIITRWRSGYLTAEAVENQVMVTISDQLSPHGKLMYLGRLLQRAAQLYPDSQALIAQNKTITYKEYYFRATQLSQKLQAAGVKARDRVLLCSENSIEFYLYYFAALQLGATIVPINTFLHEREFAYVVQDAAPAVIVASSKFVLMIEALVAQQKITCPQLLTEKDVDWQTSLPQTVEQISSMISLYDLAPDELAVLLYTSGTTGIPKGVMLSSENVMTNAMQAYTRFKGFMGKTQERFFCVLPLFHVFAQNTCMWLPLLAGVSVVVVSRIDRNLILEGLKKAPTFFFGFPALYGLLCLIKTAPLDSIKMFVSGADAMPDRIRSAFALIYGRKICTGYGLTEASPVVAVNHLNDEAPTNMVGKPLPGIAVEIRNEAGFKVAVGEIGNLWISGKNIMMGYYKAPEATALVLKDGWLNTGDLCSMDASGNLFMRGRTKDLIIHKGFNIYPQEIENVLMMHPAVSKAAVIGIDEVASGQFPVAYVAVKCKEAGIEEGLRDLCSANLASYKIPRKFICLEDLPMSPTGKVDKKQLQNL